MEFVSLYCFLKRSVSGWVVHQSHQPSVNPQSGPQYQTLKTTGLVFIFNVTTLHLILQKFQRNTDIVVPLVTQSSLWPVHPICTMLLPASQRQRISAQNDHCNLHDHHLAGYIMKLCYNVSYYFCMVYYFPPLVIVCMSTHDILCLSSQVKPVVGLLQRQ